MRRDLKTLLVHPLCSDLVSRWSSDGLEDVMRSFEQE